MTCFLHISSAVKYLKDNPDLCVQLIQECLSPAERRQIVEDLHDQLPDICQSIDNLNTALSFLKALGGQTSVFLHEFMSSTLKMKHTLYSGKVETIKNGEIAGDCRGRRLGWGVIVFRT